MSRAYEMFVEIENFNPYKQLQICAAICVEWPFDGLDQMRGNKSAKLCATGEGSLHSGELEDEFAKRLTHVIWKANRAYCNVLVHAYYLEDLPFNDYELTKDDYAEFTKSKQLSTSVTNSGK